MEIKHECANVHKCTCPNTGCKHYGKCCSCVVNHRKNGSTPNCYKYPEPEAD